MTPDPCSSHNIASMLTKTAEQHPQLRAVVVKAGHGNQGRAAYAQLTFRQLEAESDRLANGLRRMGVLPGHKLVLMVRPGLEFVALVFAIFKTGAVLVLIDPGMGRSNIFRCLADVDPDGFVAIPIVHVIRILKSKLFPNAEQNVTVGPRWFWGGKTYQQLLAATDAKEIHPVNPADMAAIIFTSGSTGTPKGVCYEHGMFQSQVQMIQSHFEIQSGEVELSAFPLFALFNAAMGVTTVIPDMDPSQPAQADPAGIIQTINDQGITQAYGSPALWKVIARHCAETGDTLPTLQRVLSAGAPVAPHLLQAVQPFLTHPQAYIATPYGATESLPISSITDQEILSETASKTKCGAGTCVGKPLPNVDVRIMEIRDGSVETTSNIVELTQNEIGEIIVNGPSTTKEYFRNPEATARCKIYNHDKSEFWHRMGDVGYLDKHGRLWFCGRKDHIVKTQHGRMYTVCCEAIFNEHPQVFRSALIGLSEREYQRPGIVVELVDGVSLSKDQRVILFQELRQLAMQNTLTQYIDTFFIHPAFPVDTRHNVKINREQLTEWAAKQKAVNV